MSKSRGNSLQNKYYKPSCDRVVDWRALLKLAIEFDLCIVELKELRGGILEVQQKYFPSDKPFEGPNDMEPKSVAREFHALDRLWRSCSGRSNRRHKRPQGRI